MTPVKITRWGTFVITKNECHFLLLDCVRLIFVGVGNFRIKMARVGDPRLGELLNRPADETAHLPVKLCFIGYPCDLGVEINQGRTGCRLGPEQFRNYTKRLCSARNPETGVDLFKLDIRDLGDSSVTENLEENHRFLEEKVLKCLNEKNVTVVIGGGKDLCYPLAKALIKHANTEDIGVVNVDSHLDVRPLLNGKLPHSGSAFYQLLEDPKFKGQLMQYGTQGSQNSYQHSEYLNKMGGKIQWLSDLKKERKIGESFRQTLASLNGRPTYVSFELDAIKASDCPGVSCPGVVGKLRRDDWRTRKVSHKRPFVKVSQLKKPWRYVK